MEDTENIEEEVTRSNFAFFLNNNLNIKGSMGLFPDRIQVSDISAIERQDSSSQQFLHSKSSSASVFDRLIQDTNKRLYASKKVSDYRIMLELEYENSFLTQAKLSRESEDELLNRLMLDAQRRYKNYEVLENFKKNKEKNKEFIKLPAEKINELTTRLSANTKNKIQERENINKIRHEEEIKSLQIIRNQKHPKRELNKDIFYRITAPKSPPKCTNNVNGKEKILMSSASAKTIQEVVDRLHKTSPLKINIPFKDKKNKKVKASEKFSLTSRRKTFDDDYSIKLKANGGKTSKKILHK